MQGKEPIIPESDFMNFAVRASVRLDNITLNRLRNAETFEKWRDIVIFTVLLLTEYLYNQFSMNGVMGFSNISGLSAGKMSVSAKSGAELNSNPEYDIILENLWHTGLLYTGVCSRCN